jgi:hypothetical protein
MICNYFLLLISAFCSKTPTTTLNNNNNLKFWHTKYTHKDFEYKIKIEKMLEDVFSSRSKLELREVQNAKTSNISRLNIHLPSFDKGTKIHWIQEDHWIHEDLMGFKAVNLVRVLFIPESKTLLINWNVRQRDRWIRDSRSFFSEWEIVTR